MVMAFPAMVTEAVAAGLLGGAWARGLGRRWCCGDEQPGTGEKHFHVDVSPLGRSP